VDDVVDEVPTRRGGHQAGLVAQRGGAALRGAPTHPVMQALMPLARLRHHRRHLLAVIEGCQMDLEQTRYLDYPACSATATWWPASWARWRRASSARPTRRPRLRPRLGLALQLTNIIRDVGEDAMRGRIYLPVSELQQFDVKAHESCSSARSALFSDRFTALMRFQAERAHRCTTRPWRCCPPPTAAPRSRG
jgi:phytoene synthase